MKGRKLGPFELEEQVGVGGMGVVYRAKYVKNGRLVAVKLLSPALNSEPKLIARFERELEVLKKLQHPNIVQLYGGGRSGEQRFFAMEYVEGGNLSQLLREQGRLNWMDVIEYGKQVCAALEHAHELGIIHRDLKPANLMLDRNKTIKLADFGLARVPDATALTAAGKTLGTFAYMAPEQITGKAPITPKTDLYALGCVLYELLIGKPPFESESTAELFYQHLKKKPPRICTQVPDCPVWLEVVVLQLLEKDPEKRPRDALIVTQMLKEAAEREVNSPSILKHLATGDPSTLGAAETQVSSEEMRTEITNLLKSKKKKSKRTNELFYEKSWFLISCLVGIVALVAWSFWPLSEQVLYERGKKLMVSEDPLVWNRARDDYFEPLLKRFPSGKYAAEVQEIIEQIEIDRNEERLLNRISRGIEPRNEAERLFFQAYRYETFGDRITALEKYDGLIGLLGDLEEHAEIVSIARSRAQKIRDTGGDKGDRQKIVEEALKRAQDLRLQGSKVEARKIWKSIVELYGDNRELEELVDIAREELDDKGPGSISPLREKAKKIKNKILGTE